MKQVTLKDNGEAIVVINNENQKEEFRFSYAHNSEMITTKEYAYRMLRNVFLPENQMEEIK